MPQMIQVGFPCQEGKAPELLELLKGALVETRAIAGCETVEVFSNVDDPDSLILWDAFVQRSTREAYLAWRMETGLPEMLGP
jgi:quinol monooxygenase YgiN